MEVHISITGDDESGKKVLDILTGGGILDNLETPAKQKNIQDDRRSTQRKTSTWMKYQKRFLESRWTNEQ